MQSLHYTDECLPISIAGANIIIDVIVGTEHHLRHLLGNASISCEIADTLIFVVALFSTSDGDIYLGQVFPSPAFSGQAPALNRHSLPIHGGHIIRAVWQTEGGDRAT